MAKRHKVTCTLCPPGKRSMTPYTLRKHVEHVHDKKKLTKDRKIDRHAKRWCRICKKFITRRTTNHFRVHKTLGELTDTPFQAITIPEPETTHPQSDEPAHDTAYEAVSDMGGSAFMEEQKEDAIPANDDHEYQITPHFGNVTEITKQMKTLKFEDG